MGIFDFWKKNKHLGEQQQVSTETNEYTSFENSGGSIELTDFNFRLAIIQELMYEQDLLPQFDVWEFCDQYTAREIDIEEEGYDVIPEVKAWFEVLPISREMAEQVTKLYFDGGNEVYGQIVPFWDGEDDLYDITQLTPEDLAQFPNLKTIDGTALLMTEEVKETFRQAGIEVIE